MSMSTHLYRSRDDRMLAGVAGGLAELWDADPSLVRVIWALLVVFTGGIALVVYIVMALVVPEEDETRPWGGRATRWESPGASAAAGSGGEPPAPPAPGAPSAGSAAIGAAQPVDGASGPTGPGPASPDWTPSRFEAPEMRHEARRAAREARRARRGRDGRSGAIVVGVLLILVGTWYLVREYLPAIDWDWFWPLVLVGVGVLVLVLAVRPREVEPGPPASHPEERSS
jgi:phage shock protein C